MGYKERRGGREVCTVLVLEPEDRDENDSVEQCDAEGDEVVEAPPLHLRELRCDKRGAECARAYQIHNMIIRMNHCRMASIIEK